MLTRITRYTLLVLCLLVAGVWGWSYWHIVGLNIDYRNAVTVDIQQGAVRVFYWRNDTPYGIPPNDGSDLSSPTDRIYWVAYPANSIPSQSPSPRAGWMEALFNYSRSTGRFSFRLPLGFVFTPLLLLTVAVWYRPIRNRLRGKRDAGFEVEVKEPSL